MVTLDREVDETELTPVARDSERAPQLANEAPRPERRNAASDAQRYV
jgi:hypothetical protein